MIEIIVDLAESEFDTISIMLDSTSVEYQISNDIITIDTPIDFGLHMLEIKLIGDSRRISFKDVKILGSSLRECLYMSYLERQDGSKEQPQTVLWETDQKWILPFANPVSFWLTLVKDKLKPGDLGTYLYDRYYIEYPDRMSLPDTFPELIKNFYKHNFDFICIDKEDTLRRPYMPHPGVSEKFRNELAEYMKENKEFLLSNSSGSLQEYYNTLEFGKSLWRTVRVFQTGKQVLDVPWVDQLKQELGIEGIWSMTIGFLPPGGILAPHIDNEGKVKKYFGCCVIYMPLTWPEGSTFKFNGAPILFDSNTIVINNSEYVHALTNGSDQDRVIITITPEQ